MNTTKYTSIAHFGWHTSLFTLVTFVCLYIFATPLSAATIQLDTGLTNKGLVPGQVDPSVTWNYTGDYADPRFNSYVDHDFSGTTSCHFVGGNCRTSNNRSYGPDVPSTYPTYVGVQFFYLTFDLPVAAQNVMMNVTEVGADDRVGFHLNDNEIGFWGNVRFAGDPSQVQFGRMDGSDRYPGPIGPGAEPTRFGVPLRDPFIQPDFVLNDPGLFDVGGTNVVRLWVNNTGVRSNSAGSRPMNPVDPSVVGFHATVTYNLTVPEPASLLLFGFGLAGLAYTRRRRSMA